MEDIAFNPGFKKIILFFSKQEANTSQYKDYYSPEISCQPSLELFGCRQTAQPACCCRPEKCFIIVTKYLLGHVE